MFEIARNNTGLLEGRKPVATEEKARLVASNLADETGEAYQLWNSERMIDVVVPRNTLN